ncbi:hypothetical protein HY500_02365 [Candidatus Woesearchaeota archaeon]|nr:hypothetical protein [Candidatus Woesearchaeota archaeon]
MSVFSRFKGIFKKEDEIDLEGEIPVDEEGDVDEQDKEEGDVDERYWERGKMLSGIGAVIGGVALATIAALEFWPKDRVLEQGTQGIGSLPPKERVAYLDSLVDRQGYTSTVNAINELLRAGTLAWNNGFALPSTAIDSLTTRLSRAQKELTQNQRRLAYIDSSLVANGFSTYAIDRVFEALEAKSRATPSGKELEIAYAQGARTGLESAFALISQKAKELDYTSMVEPGIIKFRAVRRNRPLTTRENETAIREQRDLDYSVGRLEGFGVREGDITDYIAGKIEILVTMTPVSGTPSQVSVRDNKGKNITTYNLR